MSDQLPRPAIDLRLGLPALAAWLAAGLVIGMPALALPIAIGLWAATGAALAAAVLRPRAGLSIVALCALGAAVCCTSVALESAVRVPGVVAEAAASGRQVSAVATVTQTILPGTGSFPVQVSAFTIGTTVYSSTTPVLVFGERPEERVGIGSTITVRGTLSAADPGESIAFLLFSAGPPTVISGPPWYLDWADQLRRGLGAAASDLPGDGGDLLPGLAIGDTSAVSDPLDAAMKATSLSHLTAVSGANCAVVIALVMAGGAALGLRRGIRIGGSVVVLVAFVVLVTPEPSVLRAAVMALLVLVALGSGRPVRGIPVLAVATIALLVVDPWLARSYGFGLSVLATGGLLLFAGPISRWLGRFLPRWLAVVIAVPLAAQLACQPVIIMLNAALPTYGVFANILAEPAAPIATVLGLIACVALAVFPPLGVVLTQLAWLPAAWIAAVAQFFAQLPGAQLPWPGGPGGVVLLALLTALALGAMLAGPRRRRILGFALVACLVGYFSIVGGGRAITLASRPANWQIAGCDIGQGDAFVVRSEGMIALIDTGPDPKLLTECLAELGISHIDLLVLTHYDLDHVGGVSAVYGHVSRAFIGPGDDNKEDHIIAGLLSGGANVQQVSRGPTGMLGELRWSILWPPSRLVGIEPGNPASVTMLFEPAGACGGGCLGSIFLGDLGQHAQELLLAANPALGRVDVVKVSHHGSSDQSERLYQRLQATVGLVGVGVDNDYGHPTDTLLGILNRAGTAIERTDLDGMILVSPGPTHGTVSVWTEK